MTYETLLVERHGTVGWLIFNRPDVGNSMRKSWSVASFQFHSSVVDHQSSLCPPDCLSSRRTLWLERPERRSIKLTRKPSFPQSDKESSLITSRHRVDVDRSSENHKHVHIAFASREQQRILREVLFCSIFQKTCEHIVGEVPKRKLRTNSRADCYFRDMRMVLKHRTPLR